MSNIKISQLPNWAGGNTTGSFIVMNDSGSNTTYKIRKEDWLFPYRGNATITGSLNVTNNITAISSSVATSTTISDSIVGGNLQVANGYVRTPLILGQIGNTLTGTLDLLTLTRLSLTSSIGDVNISAGESGVNPKNIRLSSAGGTINSGSLTVSGSAAGVGNGLNVIGNSLFSGSVNIQGSSAAGAKYLFFASSSGSAGGIISYQPSGELSIYQSDTGSCRLFLGNPSGSNTLYGNTSITGSLTVSGSGVNLVGNTVLTNTGVSNNVLISTAVVRVQSNTNNRSGSLSNDNLRFETNTGSLNGVILDRTSLSFSDNNGTTDIRKQSGSFLGMSNSLNITGSLTVSSGATISGSVTLNGINKSIYFSSGSSNSLTGAYISYDPTALGAGGLLVVNTSGSVPNIGSVQISAGRVYSTYNSNTGIATHFASSSLRLQSSNNVDISGSVNMSTVMTLTPQSTLPTGTTGSLAVSGSGLYFHNGTSWNLIS